ncbi:MAG TPA: hypothetical protein VMF30_00885, partial [Pirellulales bacterium]|nr:hypothetical protein [Pirellulales bacterium]
MGGSLAKRAQANRKPVVCALLLVAVAAVFGQTLWHDFVLIDDGVFVLDSPQVLAGLTWKGVVWAFTSGGYGEWTPLASLSHMLDCQLFGPSPGPHHATNVLLHAISAVLLFLALARMTGQRAVPDTDGTLVAKPASDADRASYRRTVPHPLSGYPAQVSGAWAAEGRAERDNTASAKPASDAHRAQARGVRPGHLPHALAGGGSQEGPSATTRAERKKPASDAHRA